MPLTHKRVISALEELLVDHLGLDEDQLEEALAAWEDIINEEDEEAPKSKRYGDLNDVMDDEDV